MQRQLQRRRGLNRLDLLGALSLRTPEVGKFVDLLSRAGVEAVADLASRRRHIGLVLFSGRDGQAPLEDEELELLTRLLDQTALALETALLLEETAQQAELERELEIAATIQAQLCLPSCVSLRAGRWPPPAGRPGSSAATSSPSCRWPAREAAPWFSATFRASRFPEP